MHWLLLLVVLGNTADATTSLRAFHRGYGEYNPLIVSTEPAPFITEVAIGTVAEVYLLHRLHRHHPRMARILAFTHIGLSIGLSIHNEHD